MNNHLCETERFLGGASEKADNVNDRLLSSLSGQIQGRSSHMTTVVIKIDMIWLSQNHRHMSQSRVHIHYAPVCIDQELKQSTIIVKL